MGKRTVVRGGAKKLSLNKETLRQLSGEELEQAAGGSLLFCGSRVGFTCSAGPGCTGTGRLCIPTTIFEGTSPLE
jgi:hypothetical protein